MKRLVAGLFGVAAAALAVRLGAQAPELALRGEAVSPSLQCGTTGEFEPGRLRPRSLPGGFADGEPLSYDQDPPLVYPDYRGAVNRGGRFLGDRAVQRLAARSVRPRCVLVLA